MQSFLYSKNNLFLVKMKAKKEHKISAVVGHELYEKCLEAVKGHKFKGVRSVTGLIEFALSMLLENHIEHE